MITLDPETLTALQRSKYMRARYKAWCWYFRNEPEDQDNWDNLSDPEDAARHAKSGLLNEEKYESNQPYKDGSDDLWFDVHNIALRFIDWGLVD